jgi:uncharacterized delta-60 repeat protein
MHLRGPHALATVPVLGLLLILFGFPASALAAGGQLDPSFGGDGKVTTHFAGDWEDRARAVAIQDDGKIVAVGHSYTGTSSTVTARFALARYNPDGTLDGSFGGDGRVRSYLAEGSEASAVAIQDDGKIVAAGYSYLRYRRVAVARYNPDGTLDDSFGGDGKVSTHFGGRSFDMALAVAIQDDGDIVAAGDSHGATHHRFALARYHPDGTLDSSFGGDGKIRTTFAGKNDAHSSAVAIQDDGRIVAAGSSTVPNVDTGPHTRFALARYDPDGTLDDSFGGDGKVVTTHFVKRGGFAEASAVAIQADGKIVAAGTTAVSTTQFALARYNLDGTLDSSFGGDGKIRTHFADSGGDVGWAVAIQDDGKIVAAGRSEGRFALARYDDAGTLDPAFGGDGKVRTHFGWGGTCVNPGGASGLAIQADGKIVAAGCARGRFALARYLAA